jgi:hypothetical protein
MAKYSSATVHRQLDFRVDIDPYNVESEPNLLLERTAYLLQNQMNPFPVSGQLSLSETGQLRFVLDASSANSHLGWVQKEIGMQDLKQRVELGEQPVIFDLPVAKRKILWPLRLGGYGMTVADGGRKWTVTLNYPSGGGISQLLNIGKSSSTSKPWKEALAAAGANT